LSSKLLTWPAPLFYENALYWEVNLGKSLIYIDKIVHGVRRPRRERTAAWLTGAAGIYLTDFSVSHFWEKYNQLTLLNWPNEGKRANSFMMIDASRFPGPKEAATILAHFVDENGPEIIPARFR